MNYPAFVDNQVYFSMDESKSEIDQIRAMSDNLKKIHALSVMNFESFDDLIEEYLKTGLEIFGMKIGIVSKIVGSEYFICNASSPEDQLKKNDVFELDGTYCREVYRSKSVIGFPHVGILEDMKDHPVYVNMKLESYISAPIYVNKEIFGTLNFSSTEVRPNGFSEYEREFIALMANSIGRFLELQAKEEALIQANERMKKLIGYVAHDLRNPLGVIKGIAPYVAGAEEEDREQMAEMIENSAVRAIEMIHTILEFAAMGTGKIELELTTMNLSRIANIISRQFRKVIGQRKINYFFDCEEDLFVKADSHRIEQVLTNLFSNVSKYTPDDGVVYCSIKKIDDQTVFELRNSSMKNDQAAKFDMDKSIGFGLEIVREILQLHGSELKVTEDNDWYITRFALNPIESPDT